jgi:hypothetical protein
LNTLVARMSGVIRRPRATLAAIVQAPSWAAVLVTTTAITFMCAIGFLTTRVGQQALVDQWERTSTAFGQPVDDAAYARMEERAGNSGFTLMYAAATSLAGGPVLAIVTAALLFVVLNRRSAPRSGPPPSFAQVLAVVAHAGVILMLRQVIATPVDYVRESIGSPTTLIQFFSMFDEASPAARFFGVIDVFVVWWIVVVAIGGSVLYQRPARSLALAFAGAYVVLALIAALVMAVSGGTA